MQFVYIIENETDATGAWTTPEKAVRAYYHDEIDDNDMIDDWGDGSKMVSVEDMIKTMSAPNADYPVLTRVRLDGAEAGYKNGGWYRDS